MSALIVFNQWTPVDKCAAAEQAILPISEAVSVTGVNALAPLSRTPTDDPVTIMVNGRGFFNVGPSPDFSVSGNVITWLNSTYSISPGDHVVAIYYYVGPGGDIVISSSGISTADESGHILTASGSGKITTAGG